MSKPDTPSRTTRKTPPASPQKSRTHLRFLRSHFNGLHEMDHSGGEGWLHRHSADTRTTVTRQRSPDGAAVSKYTGVPGPQKAGGRRALRTGTCIFLLAAGTILWLALPGGTHLGVNLNIVGIIVVCAGLLGLILRR